MQQHNSETWWRRTIATLLRVSFGTYRRCRRDLLMRYRGYVPMRRLGDVPLRHCCVFETWLRRPGDVLMERLCNILLRRRRDVPVKRRGDIPLRSLDEVPLKRRWVFHFWRTWDTTGTCSSNILLPGGKIFIFTYFSRW